MNKRPQLLPHKDIKGLYFAHIDGTYVGEVHRLKERQFLVRNRQRRNLSETCETLSAAQDLIASNG